MAESRRRFLKKALTLTAAGTMGNHLFAQTKGSPPPKNIAGSGAGTDTTIEIREQRLYIETRTLTAVIDKGSITSLKSKITGEDFVTGQKPDAGPLQLLYSRGETVSIDENRYGTIQSRKLSDNRAEVVFHGWDADGVLTVSVDRESGDLIVEPSAYSSRPGVRACRWTIGGIRPDLHLVAPLFQGVKLKLEDPLVRGSRWTWPQAWEAGLAILEGRDGGFWVHTQDSAYRYKAMVTGSRTAADMLAFDAECYGPIDNSLSAGGIAWRINVFQGDWRTPARRYRDWLWSAYGLAAVERSRRSWVYDIKLAISWCPGDPAILDALAARLEPRKVLLHFPNWRTDGYDENYPNYVASETARAFVAKCLSMGFHVMPHFNSLEVDPSHPAYARIRDFQFRDIESRKIMGWSWVAGKGIGVPESNASRLEHRDKKVMAKIHPGLGMWRSILAEAVSGAAIALSLESVFLDVTLNTFNLHNSLVDGTTSTEGMKKLIDEVAGLGSGLVVGGEGLNEITAQGQSFGQVHLFRSWQASVEGLERTGGCPLNEFLLGKLCRSFGYTSLGGRNENEQLRMRIHEEHGTIPTVTLRSSREITDPNAAVKRALDQAARS